MDKFKLLNFYREQGLSTIPIPYGKKEAAIKWQVYQKRLPTDAEITEFFNKLTNIAIVCGKVSGNLVVLDCDSSEKYEELKPVIEGKLGIDKLENCTPIVKTGKGYHIYFKTPTPVKSVKFPRLDIKGEGGYVIAPPSIHPNGQSYTFVNSNIPDIFVIASLADIGIDTLLIRLDTDRIQIQQPTNWISEVLQQGVDKGARNDTCFRLAGYFKERQPKDITIQILLAWNQKNRPPLNENEILTAVNSAYTYADNNIYTYIYTLEKESDTKAYQSVSKAYQSVSRALTIEAAKAWIDEQGYRYWAKKQLDYDLSVSTPGAKAYRRNILRRLREEKYIEGHPTDTDKFRKISCEDIIDFKSVMEYQPLDLWLPFDIHKHFNTYPGNLLTLAGVTDSGKGHPLGTPILTKEGWKLIEQLEVGDKVFNAKGKFVSISNIFHRGIQPCYHFEFNDGSSVESDADHLWKVKFCRHRKTGQGKRSCKFNTWDVVSTKDLIVKYGLGEIDTRKQHRPHIPSTKPLSFYGKWRLPLLIDPYCLGLLIGDGNFTGAITRFTTIDNELLEALRDIGFEVPRKYKNDYQLSNSRLSRALSYLGLRGKNSHSKFIPSRYLEACAKHRVALLQGLMDTDGYVSENGKSVEYSTVSKQLAEDVAFLVRSLGEYVSVKKRTQPACWRLNIKITGFNPFRLQRKRDRVKEFAQTNNRALTKISYAGYKPTICLKVDDNEELYLTKDLIVTHNTALAVNIIKNNDDKWVIDYWTNELSAEELNERLQNIEPDKCIEDWNFNAKVIRPGYLQKIRPDILNIFDYLDVGDPFYQIAGEQQAIHDAIGKGVAVIFLQKDDTKILGRGKGFSAQLPRLYISMGMKTAYVYKAKTPKNPNNPLKGKTCDFKLRNGVHFEFGEWRYKDYENSS